MPESQPDGGGRWIDAHCHLGPSSAGLVPAERLIKEMDRNGVRAAIVSPAGLQGPASVAERNDFVLDAVRAHPDRLIGFACVDLPGDASARDELKRAADSGLAGVKLRPGLAGFQRLARSLHAVVQVAAAKSLPVYVHPGTELLPIADDVAELAGQFPDLPFVLSYRKGPRFHEKAVAAAGRCPNVLFDTSGLSAENIRLLFSELGESRLVFGSGFPFGSQRVELSKARATLPAGAVPIVMGDNIRTALESCGIRVPA